MLDGTRVVISLVCNGAQHVVNVRITGVERQRMPQMAFGFVVLLLLAQYESEANAGIEIIGGDRNGTPVAFGGF